MKSYREQRVQKDIKSLYITSREPGAGSMVLALGLMEIIRRHYARVALFRPIAIDAKEDSDIATLLEFFSIEQSIDKTVGISRAKAEKILANEGLEAFLEVVLEHYESLKKSYDFILCMGTRLDELNRLIGFDLNIELAKNLSAPIAGVFNMLEKTQEEFIEELRLWARAISNQGAEIFMICGNHCAENICNSKLKDEFDFPICCLPKLKELEHLTIMDIIKNFPIEPIALTKEQRENSIYSVRLGTMSLNNYLNIAKEGELLITSFDRVDLVAGVMLLLMSEAKTKIGGILLCGDSIDERVLKLLKGLDESFTPILHSKLSEYELLSRVTKIKPSLSYENRKKIDLTLNLFKTASDIDLIEKRLATIKTDILTPAMFRLRLFERARRELKSIILPEVEDDRILKACDAILRQKVANIILVGKESDIRKRQKRLGINLKLAKVIDNSDEDLIKELAKAYYELRKDKGLSLNMALDRVRENKTLFATLLLYKGVGDGLVSGAIHSTRDTISPALSIIKTKEGHPIASSCFFMCLPTKVLVYADCAINLDPTPKELATIALQSVETAIKFDIEPKVAMLSYSTGDSGVGKDVDKVKEATKILRSLRPDILVAGPIQYDAAIDKDVAKIKMPNSKVAGDATIFIFPDLDTGNIAYKAVQRSSGAIAVGPIMQGLKKPVNDLSRGCLIDDIIDTITITAIQAQEEEQ